MMLIGKLFIGAALLATLGCIGAYLYALYVSSARPNQERAEASGRAGKILFFVAAACVVGAAVVLECLLQAHRFDVAYVEKYSARGLSPGYLFATFWAGQEGSFLLWAFWTSILGAILVSGLDKAMQRRVMPFYGAVLAFLMVLLTVKSPFAPLAGSTPPDGTGLNPLLENPWMVIHPPTLFLGFSSSAITFAFAISALVFGDDPGWYRRAWPWALFCFSVLGFGIMLGGYWAYDTLGWGGFWGWDPVENGPLVPWLMMVGFLHSAQVQRARGGLRPTTYLLGLLPFILLLYETFLTRTGVLDQFSVHSFSTLGGVANSIILWGMLAVVAVSLGLLVWRARSVKSDIDVWANVTSREFGFLAGIILLAICALLTGIGMSAPLVTQLGVDMHIARHASSMDADYYNKANFPVAILLAIGMGVAPYLAWRASEKRQIEALQWPYALAVGATLVYFAAGWLILGIHVTVPMLLLFAAAAVCLFANIKLLWSLRGTTQSTGGRTVGGTLAHIGAACLLLGIVLMVAYTRKTDAQIYEGHATSLGSLPYTMTYAGMSSKAADPMRDPTNLIEFQVEAQPEMDLAQMIGRLPGRDPVSTAVKGALNRQIARDITRPPGVMTIGMPLAVRQQEGRPVLLARPVIQPHWWGDLYYALKSGPDQYYSDRPITFNLNKGESRAIAGYTYTFDSFSVPPATAAQLQAGKMPDVVDIGANVTVTDPDGRVSKIVAHNIMNRLDPVADPHPWAPLPRPNAGPWWGVSFMDMDANSGRASFALRDVSRPEVTGFTLEVSTRPFVWLVWLGTVLVAAGGLISMRRRALENRLIPVEEPRARVGAPEPKPVKNGRSAGKGSGAPDRRVPAGVARALDAKSTEGNVT